MEKQVLLRKEKKVYNIEFFKDHNELENPPRRNKRKAGAFTYSHNSTNESDFEKHFADKLVATHRLLHLFVIEKTEDKLSLKTFITQKWRTAGNHFYQDKKSVIYTTFNLKTLDVYQGSILNYHRKLRSTKTISKNGFNNIPSMKYKFDNLFSQFGTGFKDFYNDVIDIINKHFGYECDDILSIFEKMAIDYYVRKGIKLPNNISVFLNSTNYTSQLIPTIKVFRKFKNKFIDGYMEHNGIYGKEIKKILHQTKLISNIHGYKSMVDLFGYDMLYRTKTIRKILESPTSHNYWGIMPTNLSKKQTEILFQYFIWLYDGLITSYTLNDHIRYYTFLEDKDENISFNAKTIDEFVNEHSDWSVLVSSYQKGYCIREYPSNFEEKITESIMDFNGVEYHPVLLKTTAEYENESTVQSNCVRTYIESSHSVILSVRMGSNESKERATIEYSMKVNDKTKRIEPMRVQSLGRFNNKLPEGWGPILEILDKKVLELINNDFKMGIKIGYKNGKSVKKETAISNSHSELIWGGETTVTSNHLDFFETNLFPQ